MNEEEMNIEENVAETTSPEVAEQDITQSIAMTDIEAPIEEDDFDTRKKAEKSYGPSPNFMQNRELSWLTFNERVLDQGADESVPLLERLNFISIFWSNLQEFFMVRVGSLTDLSFIEPPIHDTKSGMTPKEQIRAIHERCNELYPIQESYYEHVRGSLAKQGVRHLRPEDLSEEQRNYLHGLVQHNIKPFLSPQIINARHPFPHLENGKLYILVRLDDEEQSDSGKKKKGKKSKKKTKGGADGVVLGLIPLPHQCERIIKLPGRGFQFILLEHAIEMFVPEFFSMYKIKHTNVICVTRNADIDANQGFDEQDEDYREHMRRLLKKRARLAPVRLECERPLSPVMEKLMLKKLKLKRFQVYDTIVPLDLSFTWGLPSKLSEKKQAKLTNKPFSPAWPTCFDKDRRIIDQVTERETLMFYPYESMDPFVQLLREASADPDVISIKITLYRLASMSQLAEALIAAADAGKEVTALFELRARFDENNNIEWSQRFEEAGCNVLYGFRDYKVHSKICCITKRRPDGSLLHITQLGTGNYNEKTAKLYTDLSFITTSEAFGQDAVEFFHNMQLENVSDNYKTLCVAPLQIKAMILENLDKQIALARAGKPAVAFMKANSITDKDVIEKISEASNAGVKITLFIRGICCLVPGVKGATENVRVVSIVGRLLEHSRIYCFGTGEDCVVYLSSADLMTRNLNKRIEIAWPVLDPELRGRVLTYIDICMTDTAKLRELRPNATYTPLGAFCEIDEEGNAQPAYDSQNALIDQAAEAARAATEAREETREAETTVETVVETATVADQPAPDASERVAELIDQLATAPDQQVEPALDHLAEMRIEEIIPTGVSSQPYSSPLSGIAETGSPFGIQTAMTEGETATDGSGEAPTEAASSSDFDESASIAPADEPSVSTGTLSDESAPDDAALFIEQATEQQDQAEAEAEVEVEVEAETETNQGQQEPEPESETEPEQSQPELEPEQSPQEPEPEPEAEPEPEPEIESKSEPDSETEQSQPDLSLELETALKQSQPAPESDLKPSLEPALEQSQSNLALELEAALKQSQLEPQPEPIQAEQAIETDQSEADLNPAEADADVKSEADLVKDEPELELESQVEENQPSVVTEPVSEPEPSTEEPTPAPESEELQQQTASTQAGPGQETPVQESSPESEQPAQDDSQAQQAQEAGQPETATELPNGMTTDGKQAAESYFTEHRELDIPPEKKPRKGFFSRFFK